MGLAGWTPTAYGVGFRPAIAVADTFSVTVHQERDDLENERPTKLYARLGDTRYTVRWRDPFQYDAGQNPAVATTPSGVVVEMHEAVDSALLWCHLGRVGLYRDVPQHLTFFSAKEHHTGWHPSVAVAEIRGYGAVAVEAHEAGDGTLWCSVGTLDPMSDGIEWSSAFQYGSGYRPSIAVSSTGTVVEVHQAEPGGPTTLWNTVGSLEPWRRTIAWAWTPFEYTYGMAPSVAIRPFDDHVVEVHQAETGVSAMWWRSGVVTDVNAGIVDWREHGAYDTGQHPRVGLGNTAIVEVHEAGDGSLWQQGGRPLQ